MKFVFNRIWLPPLLRVLQNFRVVINFIRNDDFVGQTSLEICINNFIMLNKTLYD